MRNNKPRSNGTNGSAKRKKNFDESENEMKPNISSIIKYSEKRKLIKINQNIFLTDKQKGLLSEIENNKIITITGGPGTGKTFLSCYAAIKMFIDGKIDKIYLTTPIVEVGNSLGFLKGSLSDKTEVYIEKFTSNFEEIIDPKVLGQLMTDKVIEFKPTQFMRGSNYSNCVILADESQNFDGHELMTILTRLKKGKIILTGDKKQADISTRFVATEFLRELLDGIPFTYYFEFSKEDNMRDPILIQIAERYEKMEAEGKIPRNKK